MDFEFPPLSMINEIRVERGDAMLLSGAGYEAWQKYNGIEESNYNIFFIVVRDGQQWKVAQLEFFREWEDHDQIEGGKSNPILSNGDQILSMEVQPDFIVECEGHLANDSFPNFRKWIIHKMDRFDFRDFLKKEIDRAAAELKENVDRIYA